MDIKKEKVFYQKDFLGQRGQERQVISTINSPPREECCQHKPSVLSPEQILHIQLRKKIIGLSMDLQSKKLKPTHVLFGEFQKEWKLLQNKFSLLIIKKQPEISHNMKLLMKKKFNIQIYGRELVEKACHDIRTKLNYPEIMMSMSRLEKTSVVLSISQQEKQIFKQWFEENCNRQISRSQIKQELLNKLQRIDEQKQSQLEQLGNQEEKQNGLVPQLKKKKKIYIPKQQEILVAEISQKYFDEGHFKKWISKNKILSQYSAKFSFWRVNEKVKISLRVENTGRLEDHTKELRQLSIYFKFSKIFEITFLSPDNILKCRERFEESNTPNFRCLFIEGYKQPHSNENKLRINISQDRLDKSVTRTDRFKALFLQGLEPVVKENYGKIRSFINQICFLDVDIKIKLKLTHEGIKKHLEGEQNTKVKSLLDKVITEKIKKNTEVQLIKISTQLGDIFITVKVKPDFIKQQSSFLQNLNQVLSDRIVVQQIIHERDVNESLKKNYLLVKSEINSEMWSIISDSRESVEKTKEILTAIKANRSKLYQQELKYKQSCRSKLKQFVEDSKSTNLSDIFEQVKINFEGQNSIKVVGSLHSVQIICVELKKYIESLSELFSDKLIYLGTRQALILGRNQQKFKQKIYQSFQLSFRLDRNAHHGTVFYVGSQKLSKEDSPLIIKLWRSNQITQMPKGTIFYLNDNSKEILKGYPEFLSVYHSFEIAKKTSKANFEKIQKGFRFIYSQKQLDALQTTHLIFSRGQQVNKKNERNFALIIPKFGSSDFLRNMLMKFFELSSCSPLRVRVHILEDEPEKLKESIQSSLSFNTEKARSQYYINLGGEEVQYPQEVQEKIEKAMVHGEQKIYITNTDLKLFKVSLVCNLQKQEVIHMQSSKSLKLKKNGSGAYLLTLQGKQFQIPYNQMRKAELSPKFAEISFQVYELDLNQKKQVNLFSGFKRKLQEKKIDTKPTNKKAYVYSEEKTNQVQIQYEQNQEIIAQKAWVMLKQLIDSEIHYQIYMLPNPIKQIEFEKIEQLATDFEVTVQWDKKLELRISSFETVNIQRFIKNLRSNYLNLNERQYKLKVPDCWKPQTKQIQTFIVKPNTGQFQKIQSEFKAGKIKELLRIQNSLVYKKYDDQKQFLISLNEGRPVKQLMLFHGTSKTNPKLIYEDKEECFNINYTSDNNFLGRGTYFAQKSEYSDSYAYVQQGSRLRQMFYCSVLIGDSKNYEKPTSESRKLVNTDIKNPQLGIRCESNTMITLGSRIYAVYKNRRAYPAYLIRY